MATGKGVIQGYTGVAAVEGANQIIVEAQAHGTGAEQELLIPVVTALQPLLAPASIVTADAGYHSEANLRQLDAMQVTALIADNDLRRRDERFATQAAHHTAPDPLYDKSPLKEAPERTDARQVAFFRGRAAAAPPTQTARMKQRIDAPAARAQYGQRFAIVEPVFANVRYNKGLDRFTRRGRAKVEGQWRLFCLVHNIETLAHHGYAA